MQTAHLVSAAEPTFSVQFSDPDGDVNASSLRIYLDGADVTTRFAKTTWTWTPSPLLTDGQHFFYATIRDTSGSGTLKNLPFVLKPPQIDSISPTSGAIRGQEVTLLGRGFSNNCRVILRNGNQDQFHEIEASVTLVTPNSLKFIVPPGALGGEVFVRINQGPGTERVSNAAQLKLLLFQGIPGANSVTVNESVGYNDAFILTKKSQKNPYGNGLLRVLLDSAAFNTVTPLNPAGLPFDPLNGRMYFGNSDSATSAVVQQYDPISGAAITYAETKLAGESKASINGIGRLADNTLYVGDSFNSKLKRIDPATRAVSSIASGISMNNPSGLLLYPETGAVDKYAYFTSGKDIKTVNTSTGQIYAVKSFSADTSSLGGLALAQHNGNVLLFAARPSAGKLTMINLSVSGYPAYDIAASLSQPNTLDVSEDEPEIVVAAESTSVVSPRRPSVRIDPGYNRKVDADASYVVLTAILDPPTLIPDGDEYAWVTWEISDPDDPSDDSVIDEFGATPIDNRGQFTGERCEQISTLERNDVIDRCQTTIIGGRSTVKINLENQPGNNFIITARIGRRFGTAYDDFPFYDGFVATTDMITVFKTAYVERDSLKVPAIETWQEEDPCISSIPLPDISLLNDAFMPAYVNVLEDSSLSTTDVDWNYDISVTDRNEVRSQLDKGLGSITSVNHWALYLQQVHDVTDSIRSNGDDTTTGYFDNDLDDENSFNGKIPDNVAYPFATTASSSFGGTCPTNGNGITGGTLIFHETIRDRVASLGNLDQDYVRSFVSVHEIGHQFGLDEDSGGFMANFGATTPDPVFWNKHIFKIRNIDYPGCK